LQVELDASNMEAIELARTRLETFVRALDAGYFFPGTRRGLEASVVLTNPGVLSVQLQVDDLSKAALDVLSGLLLDCVYREVFAIRSARAQLGRETRDLLVETSRRPGAVEQPPFHVDLPDDVDLGNNTLLIEIAFAADVPAEIGERLLDDLALIEQLWLAYPIEDEDEESIEPVESLGAQRHFNDARTIHHYEFAWEADPVSWNLLVNLCCAWHRTIPVVGLHVE
jgi:hypothetical protein